MIVSKLLLFKTNGLEELALIEINNAPLQLLQHQVMFIPLINAEEGSQVIVYCW